MCFNIFLKTNNAQGIFNVCLYSWPTPPNKNLLKIRGVTSAQPPIQNSGGLRPPPHPPTSGVARVTVARGQSKNFAPPPLKKILKNDIEMSIVFN